MTFKLMPASIFAMFASLALVGPALAQTVTPTDDIYSPIRHKTVTVVTGEGQSSLPFSGLDVGLVVLAGLIVLATGLLVRRASRGNQPS